MKRSLLQRLFFLLLEAAQGCLPIIQVSGHIVKEDIPMVDL